MAFVPLNDETPLDQYVATASQTDFVFTFTIFATSDIEVFVNAILKVEVTDYVVKKSDNSAILPEDLLNGLVGGNVVFNSGLVLNDIVTLNREIPIERLTGYTTAGDFRATTLNVEQNKELAISQQLKRDLVNSVTKAPNDTLTGSLLLPLNRGDLFLAFDVNGGLIATAGPTGDSNTPVSAYVSGFFSVPDSAAALTYFDITGYAQTILDDTTAGEARTTLDAQENLSSVFSAEGDIIVADSSTDAVILPRGTNNQALISDGTTLIYQDNKFPPNHLVGLTTENNSGDSDHDIDIAIGTWRDSADTQSFTSASPFTKQLDLNWSEGTNLGGFPSALTLAADTWYHIFAIGKPDGSVDYGFDTSLTATNLLADATGYTKFRRIWCIKTDASVNILGYIQMKDIFYFNPTFEAVDVTGFSLSTLTFFDDVFPAIKIEGRLQTYTEMVNTGFHDLQVRGNKQPAYTGGFIASNYRIARAGEIIDRSDPILIYADDGKISVLNTSTNNYNKVEIGAVSYRDLTL